MDLMDSRRLLMSVIAEEQIDFINHVDVGSFVGPASGMKYVTLKNVTGVPKGIIVFTNELDTTPPEADKVFGAYASVFINGTEDPNQESPGTYSLMLSSTYAVNWGSYEHPTWRSTRTESRGLRRFLLQSHQFIVYGFGNGNYDFKPGITYNWIAWD